MKDKMFYDPLKNLPNDSLNIQIGPQLLKLSQVG